MRLSTTSTLTWSPVERETAKANSGHLVILDDGVNGEDAGAGDRKHRRSTVYDHHT
jgi:hypothetical protein